MFDITEIAKHIPTEWTSQSVGAMAYTCKRVGAGSGRGRGVTRPLGGSSRAGLHHLRSREEQASWSKRWARALAVIQTRRSAPKDLSQGPWRNYFPMRLPNDPMRDPSSSSRLGMTARGMRALVNRRRELRPAISAASSAGNSPAQPLVRPEECSASPAESAAVCRR